MFSQLNVVEASSFTENEQVLYSRNVVPYSDANIVNYNTNTKAESYEYFDSNFYSNRYEVVNNLLTNTGELDNNLMVDNLNNDMISPMTIIGSDDRTQILNGELWPYRATAKIEVTYSDVENPTYGYTRNREFVGTGFMVGPNILVTAGHVVYGDVTDKDSWDNGVNDPVFADIVEIYCGADSALDLNDSYKYYAKAKVVNISKSYYNNSNNFNYDWAVIELDRNIGEQTGWYDIISNWFIDNSNIFSYGYPGDKPRGTMWEAHGKMTSKTTYQYDFNIDAYPGQSGSPVFMTNDFGDTYVCGILAWESNNINGGTRINSFIYHYINSYICHLDTDLGTIRPNEYGFADAYPTDQATQTTYTNHTTDAGVTFQTRRYRTGYIHNEYIVMSCIRTGITEAFIEYKFSVPITKIVVYLSHWRTYSNEWLDNDSGMAELQFWKNGGWNTRLDLLSNEVNLPTDRTNPTTYTIVFDEPVYVFRFYSEVYTEQTSSNNRGRICIGDIQFFTKD